MNTDGPVLSACETVDGSMFARRRVSARMLAERQQRGDRVGHLLADIGDLRPERRERVCRGRTRCRLGVSNLWRGGVRCRRGSHALVVALGGTRAAHRDLAAYLDTRLTRRRLWLRAKRFRDLIEEILSGLQRLSLIHI